MSVQSSRYSEPLPNEFGKGCIEENMRGICDLKERSYDNHK